MVKIPDNVLSNLNNNIYLFAYQSYFLSCSKSVVYDQRVCRKPFEPFLVLFLFRLNSFCEVIQLFCYERERERERQTDRQTDRDRWVA